jgi:hypothetical protein
MVPRRVDRTDKLRPRCDGHRWKISADYQACGQCKTPQQIVRLPSLICPDAALFFDPTNTEQIGKALTKICSDEGLRDRLTINALKRRSLFSSSLPAIRQRRFITKWWRKDSLNVLTQGVATRKRPRDRGNRQP